MVPDPPLVQCPAAAEFAETYSSDNADRERFPFNLVRAEQTFAEDKQMGENSSGNVQARLSRKS
eukprot:711515-Pyramimonas_sp.AAC.1